MIEKKTQKLWFQLRQPIGDILSTGSRARENKGKARISWLIRWVFLDDSRDPLVNGGDGELASLLKSVLYQFRIGEGWLLRPVGSRGRKIPIVCPVNRISHLIRILPIRRWTFVIAVSSFDVACVIRAMRPSVWFVLVAWKCTISHKAVKSVCELYTISNGSAYVLSVLKQGENCAGKLSRELLFRRTLKFCLKFLRLFFLTTLLPKYFLDSCDKL